MVIRSIQIVPRSCIETLKVSFSLTVYRIEDVYFPDINNYPLSITCLVLESFYLEAFSKEFWIISIIQYQRFQRFYSSLSIIMVNWNLIWKGKFIGNKTKGRISKRVFQESLSNCLKNEHFLPPDTHTYVCVSGGN